MATERLEAYSINDEYPINDCFGGSLIGCGKMLIGYNKESLIK